MTPTDTLEYRRGALALRRFVRERAAGRAAPEWVVFDPDLGAWLGASEAEATAGNREWRRVRKPGEPWCVILGRDLTVARDDFLQAMFATIDPDDPTGWRRLWIDVDCSPSRCLTDWRARGRHLLAAVTGGPGSAVGTLAGRFAVRGRGKRSLEGI